MNARTMYFWIVIVIGALLTGGIAHGDIRHAHPLHRHTRTPDHGSQPKKRLHGDSVRGSVPHAGIPKKFRSRGKLSVGKSGNRSRKSSARRSRAKAGGLHSLPRATYPTVLRGSTEVDGRFLRPIDGDTFAMNGIKVRMSGLDAPELGTPGGIEAAQHLAALLQEGRVTIVPRSRDVYGRTVADVFMNGQNLAERMIAEGFARRG